MKNIRTFRGCMIGGAAGDALGYAVEFTKADGIFRKYGPEGITEYEIDPADGTAHISDDTQMTLFTAGGLLTGKAMNVVLGYPVHIYRAYLDWFRAQSGEGIEADETVFGSTWLFRVPALNFPRHPGHTCMSALGSGKTGSIEKPLNDSCGCGGVMRVAPVGLFFTPGEELKAEEIDLLGAQSAAITHGHEMGWLPAALLTRIISTITYSESHVVPSRSDAEFSAGEKKEALRKIITDSVEAFRSEFAQYENTAVLAAMIEKAKALADEDTEDLCAVSQLGEGWVGHEALAVAVYCVLKHADDFEKCLIAAVNHDGDSDSTGAVAGNILGAFLGDEAIPAKFREKLEIVHVITDIADDLFTVSKPVGDDLWTAKYIMNNYKI